MGEKVEAELMPTVNHQLLQSLELVAILRYIVVFLLDQLDGAVLEHLRGEVKEERMKDLGVCHVGPVILIDTVVEPSGDFCRHLIELNCFDNVWLALSIFDNLSELRLEFFLVHEEVSTLAPVLV